MSNPRYPEECKIEAIRQVTKRGLGHGHHLHPHL